MLDAEGADCFEFGFGEDFADGVVGRVEDDHAGFGGDGVFEGFEVESPVCGGSFLCGTIGRGLKGDVADCAAGHFDVGDVSG